VSPIKLDSDRGDRDCKFQIKTNLYSTIEPDQIDNEPS